MKVKNKILLTVIPLMFLFIILLNITFGLFFQNHIKLQEEHQINIATNSLSNYISEKFKKYQGSANDWGHWDDTFKFIDEKSSEYIRLNLSEYTYENLDLNFIILTNNDEEIIYQQYYSMENNEFVQFPPNFHNTTSIISFSKLEEDVSSIIKIGENFYFIASTDITDSTKTKLAKGKMIIGREIDSSIIEDIEGVTGLNVSSISTLENMENMENMPNNEISTILNKTYSPSSDLIYIKLAIPNKYRIQDSIQINFEMPRNLYVSSMKSVFHFAIFNTAGCILITLIIITILGNLLTKPFEDLMQEVLSIDTTNDKYSRVAEKGNKEFSYLRKSINNLLSKIENSQKELSDSKKKFEATLTSVGDGVIATDEDHLIVFMNPVAQNLTGWKYEDVKNKSIDTIFNIINEYTREHVKSPVKAVFETGKVIELTNHTLLIAKDGTEMPIEDTAAPIVDELGTITGCVLVFRDFSERKEKQRRIEYLSYHDQLTGLFNRRFFEEELRRMDVERNRPLSIVYADVNGLKIINDAFGHESGDVLIQFVAKTIKDTCRSDDIIARIGGDEFIILLPKTDLSSTEKIIDRIKEKLAKEKVKDITISVSFGWDTKDDENKNISDILKNAENFMYQKKILYSNSKRNGIIKSILNALLIKCPREQAHSKRVSMLCERIGSAYELNEDDIKELSVAGELHDIGKIAIDESILNKNTTLNESEWSQIKKHPEIGYRLLSASSEFYTISEHILEHHERWDGKGYPKGLKGEAISWEARVIAIADSFDAMTCMRPYRKSISIEEAIEEIRKNSGTQFDPEIVGVFIEKVISSFVSQ